MASGNYALANITFIPTKAGIHFPLLALALLLSSGCATTPPSNLDNACDIYREKRGWFDDSQDAYKKWGVPAHVQLAIIYQESRFRESAKPPRTKLLWVIPWFRPTTSYGYSQAKDDTWDWYIEKSGNSGADRDDFDDACDFIAWYGNMSNSTLGIKKNDAFRQYLAYHEGHGGYKKSSFKTKSWLVKVAHNVDQRSARYKKQLWSCAEELESRWWFWPF